MEEEKLLTISSFSFFHIVFKKLVLQTFKNKGLFGKGLKAFAESKFHMDNFGKVYSLHVSALLQSVEDLGNDGNPMFAIADKMSDLGSIDQEHPVFGLKRDLIRLLGNLAYKNKQNQDLVSFSSAFQIL